MGKICTFFGHSKVNGDISEKLTEAIRTVIEKHGVTTFWCGGYGEFDAMAARTAYKLKSEYPYIKVILIRAYMPRKNDFIPEYYDETLYPDGLEIVPYRFAISHRNRWMVKNSDVVIFYITHQYGGAYAAYQYANKNKKTSYFVEWDA